MIRDSTNHLLSEDLITKTPDDCYTATPLGSATVAAGLNPEDSLFLHDEMQRALQHFAMDSDLHAFYLFTPINLTHSPNPHQPNHQSSQSSIHWPAFLDELNSLDASGQRVMSFCRINPGFVNRMANSPGPLPQTTPDEILTARIYHRFYAALQLRAICNEVPLDKVAARFRTTRGFVQSLSTTCHSFAAGIIKFCERLGWGMLAAVLEHMADRLAAGARADLLELSRIPFVKSRTARALWENGYKSLRAVAEAEPEAVAQVMVLAQPRKSKTGGKGEEGYLVKVRERARIAVQAAGRMWERESAVEVEADM